MSSSMTAMSRCLASCVLAARIAIVSGLVRHSGRPVNSAVNAFFILGMIPVREGSDMEESVDFISLISAFCSDFPFFNVYSEKSVVK